MDCHFELRSGKAIRTGKCQWVTLMGMETHCHRPVTPETQSGLASHETALGTTFRPRSHAGTPPAKSTSLKNVDFYDAEDEEVMQIVLAIQSGSVSPCLEPEQVYERSHHPPPTNLW